MIPGRAAPSQRLKGRSHFSCYLSLQPLNGGRAGSVGGLNPEQSPEPPQTRRPPHVWGVGGLISDETLDKITRPGASPRVPDNKKEVGVEFNSAPRWRGNHVRSGAPHRPSGEGVVWTWKDSSNGISIWLYNVYKLSTGFERGWSSKARGISALMQGSWAGPWTPSNRFLTRWTAVPAGDLPCLPYQEAPVAPPGGSVNNHWKPFQTQPCPVTMWHQRRETPPRCMLDRSGQWAYPVDCSKWSVDPSIIHLGGHQRVMVRGQRAGLILNRLVMAAHTHSW